jgi:hypothetical protein
LYIKFVFSNKLNGSECLLPFAKVFNSVGFVLSGGRAIVSSGRMLGVDVAGNWRGSYGVCGLVGWQKGELHGMGCWPTLFGLFVGYAIVSRE